MHSVKTSLRNSFVKICQRNLPALNKQISLGSSSSHLHHVVVGRQDYSFAFHVFTFDQINEIAFFLEAERILAKPFGSLVLMCTSWVVCRRLCLDAIPALPLPPPPAVRHSVRISYSSSAMSWPLTNRSAFDVRPSRTFVTYHTTPPLPHRDAHLNAIPTDN